MNMMKTLTGVALLAGAVLASAAFAEAPSFNYVQGTAQRVDAGHGRDWGWGVEGSFNPVGGLFVAGQYRRVRDIGDSGADLAAYRGDFGYAFKLAGTLALYGETGWSKQSWAGHDDSGAHAEIGLRARLPLLQLEGAVGHHWRNGGFDEYSATALFHVLPFTYVGVGYVSERHAHRNLDRWQAGVRLTF